jgi:hypothetical protein
MVNLNLVVHFKELYRLYIEQKKQLAHGGFRGVDQNSPVRLKQVETILFPEEFGFHRGTYVNRQGGIAVNVEDCVALGSNQFRLVLTDSDKHGIFDGNHSMSAIIECFDYWHANNLQVADEKVVINVYINLDPVILLEIVESRSSSVELKPMSIAEGRGSFDWMKDAIDSWNQFDSVGISNMVKFTSTDIAWQENSDRQPTVVQLLKYLAAVNIPLYGPISYDVDLRPIEPGIKAKGKLKIVPAFDSYNLTGNIIESLYNKEFNGTVFSKYFENQADLLIDIIRLHDFITVNAPIWSPDVQAPKTQRDHASIYESSRTYKETLGSLIFYKPKEGEPILSAAYGYMVLSALRPFFKLENDSINGKMIWRDGWNYSSLTTFLEEGFGAELFSHLRSFIQVVEKTEKNRKTGESTGKRHHSLTRETVIERANWDSLAEKVLSALKSKILSDIYKKMNFDGNANLITSSVKPAAKVVRSLTANN